MSCDEETSVVQLLIKNGADVDAVGPDGATAFHFACDMGMAACAIALIHAGCNRQLKDDEGMTGQQVRGNRQHTPVPFLRAQFLSWKKPASNLRSLVKTGSGQT
jgi:ankyrin repeat protein